MELFLFLCSIRRNINKVLSLQHPLVEVGLVLLFRVSADVSGAVKQLTAVCVTVCVHASHLLFLPANTLPPIIMYILCFVGPRRVSGLSSHQTFMLQKHIYTSRDAARLNLAPLLRPVIARSVCSTSQCLTWLPLPPVPHVNTSFLF